MSVNDLWTVAGGLAAIFAILGGAYGAYEVIRRQFASRAYKTPLSIFAGNDSVRDDLLRLQGLTINFDTVLDFSVWSEFSHRVVTSTEYGTLLDAPGSGLNKKSLPLFKVTEHGTLDSFSSLVVSVKDGDRLKFSYGGTGIVQVLLKGRFEVEARWYSGPSVELTLREVA